jgi:hypothetical protein
MKHITACFSKDLIKICQKSYASEKWLQIIHEFIGHPLNQHVFLNQFENGKIILAVDCSLWASELRTILPNLRDHLRNTHQCFNLKFIQVKVQPELASFKK